MYSTKAVTFGSVAGNFERGEGTNWRREEFSDFFAKIRKFSSLVDVKKKINTRRRVGQPAAGGATPRPKSHPPEDPLGSWDQRGPQRGRSGLPLLPQFNNPGVVNRHGKAIIHQ